MSYNYCWNQPKRFDQYDLYLDGKIKADDFIYRTKDAESGKISSTSLSEKIDTIESKLQSNFTFKHVAELPTNGEKNVIYLIPNTETSDNENEYKEYMWDDVNNKFELIGSGAYVQQKTELEDAVKALQDEIDADVKVETDRAVEKENELDGKIDSTKTYLQNQIDNRIVINEPISISKTEGEVTTTTTIDDKAISTTTLTGTLDAESMKNSLTAESVQTVVPIAWDNERVRLGEGAIAEGKDVSLGKESSAYGSFSLAAGFKATSYHQGVGIGGNVTAQMNSVGVGRDAYSAQGSVACGYAAKSNKPTTVTLGAYFADTAGSYTCTTEGTGSITIGAGANTLNSTTADGSVTESSNAVTIGCKALNQGADSVVIGAGASNDKSGGVLIGSGSYKTSDCVVIGSNVRANSGSIFAISSDSTIWNAFTIAIGREINYSGGYSVNIGNYTATSGGGIAIGHRASSHGAANAIAIGYDAKVRDQGATVFRSIAADGTYTQLYFSGQNTPLALKYYPTEWEKKQDVDDQGNPKVDENGEPVMVDDKDKPTKGQAMMGYVVSKVITNEEGKQETKVLECGTNLLAALFPNHGLGDNPFQPTTTAIDGEEIMSFHPSDLDMPIEEDTFEPEDYQPLPVYPIVEPEIEEL